MKNRYIFIFLFSLVAATLLSACGPFGAPDRSSEEGNNNAYQRNYNDHEERAPNQKEDDGRTPRRQEPNNETSDRREYDDRSSSNRHDRYSHDCCRDDSYHHEDRPRQSYKSGKGRHQNIDIDTFNQFDESKVMHQHINNVEALDISISVDTPNKRIILYSRDQVPEYKSIFIKDQKHLKIIDHNKNGLLFNNHL